MPLLLTRGDLAPLLADQRNLETAFAGIEKAVLRQKRGEAGYAAFLRLPLADDGCAISVYATSPQQATTLRVFPFVGTAGPRRVPNQHVMLLLDSSTGGLLALLASDDLNDLRTSVPAGVGARYLAPDRARVLCILGSGRQAQSHARTFYFALPGLERIVVWSPTRANRERFAHEVGNTLGLSVEAVDDPRRAVEGADVISAAGVHEGPAVEAAWVRRGALMVQMTGRAAPPDLVTQSLFYIPTQTRPVPLAVRPGGGPADRTSEARELADVMLGLVPAREHPDQTVIYDLAAMYAWDAPIILWAFDWAVEHGIGTPFDLTNA